MWTTYPRTLVSGYLPSKLNLILHTDSKPISLSNLNSCQHCRKNENQPPFISVSVLVVAVSVLNVAVSVLVVAVSVLVVAVSVLVVAVSAPAATVLQYQFTLSFI